MSSTKVYYVILEDGDDEAHPNMFTIPIPPQNLRLGDVRANFPLKKHNYHFRFKKAFQNKFVWLDCVDEDGPVPVYDGVYFCKVSRLGEISGSRAAPQQARAIVEQTVKQPEATRAKQAASAPAQPQVSSNNDLFEWTDMDTPSPSPASNTPIPVATSANNSKHSVPKAKAPSPPPQSDNLLDFLDSSSSTAPASSSSQTISGMDFAWDSTFQSVPMATSLPSTNTSAGIGFPGIGTAPPRTVSPANIPGQQLPAKKASASKVPTELGAEAAKQFTL